MMGRMNARFAALMLVSTTCALTACTADDSGGTDTVADPDTEGETDSDVGTEETGTDTDADAETTEGADTGTDTEDESGSEDESEDTATATTAGGAACEGALAPAGTIAMGEQLSHWAGMTPEGESWDYCELEGTPFVLVISGAWCGPCQDLAAGMAGLDSGFTAQVAPIIAGLDAGTLGFVEVLLDNYLDFGPTSLDDLHQWEMAYPNDNVHLLGDETPGTDGTEPLWIYLGPVHNGGVPSGVLVDAEFNVEAMGLSESLTLAGSKYGG